MIRREEVRRLVRDELNKRLEPMGVARSHAHAHARVHVHAALLEIYAGPECSEDLDFPVRKSCVIEPDSPCYNSGYCKKLGY